MSVIVKEKDKITLYCKGADSVIYNRLRMDLESQTNTLFCRTETQEHMDQYARLGLRMLCLTKRVREGLILSNVSIFFPFASRSCLNRFTKIGISYNTRPS